MGIPHHQGNPPILKYALIICRNKISFQVFIYYLVWLCLGLLLKMNPVTMPMSMFDMMSKTRYFSSLTHFEQLHLCISQTALWFLEAWVVDSPPETSSGQGLIFIFCLYNLIEL